MLWRVLTGDDLSLIPMLKYRDYLAKLSHGKEIIKNIYTHGCKLNFPFVVFRKFV